MTTTSSQNQEIIRISDQWKLDISLKGLSLTYNQTTQHYPLRSIVSLGIDKSDNQWLNVAYSTPTKQTITYLLGNLAAQDTQKIIELYERYKTILSRLRTLIISINHWHQQITLELENEFSVRGYITDSFTRNALKKALSHRPVDKYKLLQHPDVQELLAETMTLQQLLPIQDFALKARELQKKFNEVKISGLVKNNSFFFENIEKSPLTSEQIDAVTNLNNQVLLNAAAGSGKTSTMVARMAYLCAFGFHENKGILALAYNTKAVRELQMRTVTRLNHFAISPERLQIRTFHALGMDIIKQITGQTPRLAAGIDNDDNGLSLFSECIQKLFFSKGSFRVLLTSFLGAFAAGTGLLRNAHSRQEYLAEAAQKLLELADIDCVQRTCTRSSQCRCLLLHGHCEIILHPQKEAPCTKETGYHDAGHISYRELHEGTGYFKLLRLIRKYFNTYDLPVEEQYTKPLQALNKKGLQQGKNPKFWRCIGLLKAFLTHSKNSLKDTAYLKNLLNESQGNAHSVRERIFFAIFRHTTAAWRQYLGNAIDYEDMLNEASSLIEKHHWCLPISHILIDECQDFSGARARLIQNLVKWCGARIFAVGDDWQSINRFSGSELSVMTQFDQYFGKQDTLRLETTFRSSQALSDIAAKFVAANPRQLCKKVHSASDCTEPPIAIYEQKNELELKYAIQERVRELVNATHGQTSILLLGRYNSDLAITEKVFKDPALAPCCHFMTVHSSKGLEADYVILLRVTDELLGFPSQITDDDLLRLVEPSPEDYPYAEERRLFYVALTRAKRNVSIFTIIKRNSIFVKELLDNRDNNLTKKHIQIPPGLIPPEILCRRSDCHGYYIQKRSSKGTFYGCSNYPECNSILKSLNTISNHRNPYFLRKKNKFSY